MTQLPAGGRTGRAPKWPLGADVQLDTAIELSRLAVREIDQEIEWATTARDRSSLRRKREKQTKRIRELEAMRKAASRTEREIWAELWKTPQATQWEKRGWYREVALFARHQAKAEAGSLDDAREARMRESLIGLNDAAMLRLRWEVADTAKESAPRKRSARNSSKYRGLKVVK